MMFIAIVTSNDRIVGEKSLFKKNTIMMKNLFDLHINGLSTKATREKVLIWK